MSQSRALPIAIVVGCGMIALGLYFGLRSGDGAPEKPSAGTREHVTTVDPVDLSKRVHAQATTSLDSLRPQLIRDCWEPSAAKAATPSTVAYNLDVTFDAAGKQITQGVTAQRGSARADVGACLSRQPLRLRVDPPGRNVRVTLTLQLP